jgi:predicted Zn-dependent protease with MMP-like domain
MRVFHHYAADEEAPERWKVLETDAAARQAQADAFERLVTASLDELPDQFLRWLEECPVVISEDGAKFGAYGLYVGATIARPEHAAKIFIFRDTLVRDFGHNPALLAKQVQRVVRHELGHHLGFDEDGVAALGL